MRLNNTYLLYKKGFRGINIDISATSIDFFNIARPDDINLNVGASDRFEEKFFFSKKNLSFHNTLSKSLAESDMQTEPFKKKYSISCKPLDEIIEKTKFSIASNNGNHFEYLPSPTKFGLTELM